MAVSFRVVYPGNVLADFEQLCLQADRFEVLSDVASAAQTIHTQLQIAPREFGDPCYRLHATEQLVFVRSVSPLLIYYAVHRTLPIVVVQSIAWYSPMRE